MCLLVYYIGAAFSKLKQGTVLNFWCANLFYSRTKHWFVEELLMYIKPLILRNVGFLQGVLYWPKHFLMFGIQVNGRKKPHAFKTKL